MIRAGILAAMVFGLALASPSSSADQSRVASYCSASGDVCYGIFRQSETYRFELTTAARYFGRYSICSRPPTGAATCKSFPVRRRGQSFGGVVLWQRNFPHRAYGQYRVTWRLGTHRLGPVLKFTYLPAVA